MQDSTLYTVSTQQMHCWSLDGLEHSGPSGLQMTLRAHQARPGAALTGKARTTVGFGFGFWSGRTIPGERGALAADEDPGMGRGEACSLGTIY